MKSFEGEPAMAIVDIESHGIMAELDRQRQAVLKMSMSGVYDRSAAALANAIIYTASTFNFDKNAFDVMHINAADPTPSVIEFGEHYAERVYETSGDMKREAMQQKTRNRAKGVLGPRASRYM